MPGEGWVLGLDGGGSHTVCVILDGEGRLAGRAEAGPCNHQSIPVQAAREALAEAIGSARRAAGDHDIQYACLGMAGLDREADLLLIQEMVAPLFKDIPVEIVHDAEIALAAGTGGRRFGVCIIAGTGSIALGFNKDGARARAGGWGHLLGDEGSGYDIARRGLNAATRAGDGRGSTTILVEKLLSASGVATLEDLADRIYLQGWQVGDIASLAPVVFSAAGAGDPHAIEILAGAAKELALAAEIVIKKLDLQDQAFPVVLSGGVFANSQAFVDSIRVKVMAVAPFARVLLPEHEPAYGAALMALARWRDQEQ